MWAIPEKHLFKKKKLFLVKADVSSALYSELRFLFENHVDGSSLMIECSELRYRGL